MIHFVEVFKDKILVIWKSYCKRFSVSEEILHWDPGCSWLLL